MMDIHYWNDDDTQAQPERAHINALYGIESVDDYVKDISDTKARIARGNIPLAMLGYRGCVTSDKAVDNPFPVDKLISWEEYDHDHDEATETIISWEPMNGETVVRCHVVSRQPLQETASMPDNESDEFLTIEIDSPPISDEELKQLEQEAILQYHALNRSRSEDKHSLSDGGNHV